VLATGTPEQVAEVESSHTGRYLRQVLERGRGSRAGRTVPASAQAAAGR
jgi:excinuclease ABC subunit A